jgi:hypothetical protein
MNRKLEDPRPAVGMHIDDEVIGHILDKLDKIQTQEAFERGSERYQFRRRGVEVDVEHIGGTHARLRVWTRNISAGGISLLHGSFVHPGSRCEITLPLLDGQKQEVRGTVRWCRLLAGMVHELGVQFEQEWDMELFINVATLRTARDDAEARRRSGQDNRAQLIAAADALMLEIDQLIEPPNLNRAKELCRRMQQIALLLKFEELESASRLALNSLQTSGSVARSEPLLRKVQGLARQLEGLRMQEI